jgi:ketosteroid isomerase-like protein
MTHERLIVAYFDSCNTGDPDRIAAHFTDDAVIYDTNHPPVRTAAEIGRFWQRIHGQWAGARWQVDRVVSDGQTAAIEWQMAGTADERPFIFHGSEHYAFQGELIAEIRQYWHFDRESMETGLVDYPYGNAAAVDHRGKASGGVKAVDE